MVRKGEFMTLRTYDFITGVETDIDVNAGRVESVKVYAVSASYVITDTDNYGTIIVEDTTADRTITLPTASANTSRKIKIVHGASQAGKVIIDGEGSETINGELAQYLYKKYDSISVQSDGAKWFIVESMPSEQLLLTDTTDASKKIRIKPSSSITPYDLTWPAIAPIANQLLKADSSTPTTLNWGTAEGTFTRTEITGTTQAVSKDYEYIANNTSAVEFTLPATSAVGDQFHVIGKGTGGWKILSNASASSQQLIKTGGASLVSSNNAIVLAQSTDYRDCAEFTCVTANSIWSVNNYTGITLPANWFGDATDGDLSTSGNVSLTSTTDSDMIVKNYNNLTINSGHTVTTSNRCKGLLVYVKGNCTISGTLTMTDRGANVDAAAAGVDSAGLRIRRFKTGETETNTSSNLLAGCGTAAIDAENNQPSINGNGKVWAISRAGAAGSTVKGIGNNGANNIQVPGAGASGTTGQSGGGGAAGGWSGNGWVAAGGEGSAGTCFSGGTGGGGAADRNRNSAGANGGANGGQGGAADASEPAYADASGGAGNPGGTGAGAGRTGQSGTGGLLILIVKGNLTITASGIISSNGKSNNASAGTSCGGSSGGGNILVLYAGTLTNSGTIQANGGAASTGSTANGAAGGAGSIQGPTQIIG